MNPDRLFDIAGPHVVADEIEGEVIVLNLESGAYYSFRGSASSIWRRLMSGAASDATIVDGLCADYTGERGRIAEASGAFLDRVAAEGLIVEIEPTAAPFDARSESEGGRERSEFVAPAFEKYTDMEQFLLVDPIHEVDVSRWPKVDDRG